MTRRLPNFLIVGAAKSGSTALYEYLTQHPAVFMSEPKEPHFLAFEGARPGFTGPGDEEMINSRAVTDLDRYTRLFSGAGAATAVGEASVSYLYYPSAVEGIKRHVPHARIVAVLRNPIERAYSGFTFMRSRVLEPETDFRAALDDEERRIAAGWHHIWHYKRMGCYADQVQRYFDAFGRDQVRFYLFDDFRSDPISVLHDCCRFLGIPEFQPTAEPAPLMSGEPKNAFLSRLFTRDSRLKDLLRPVVPESFRRGTWRRWAKANVQKTAMDPAVRTMLAEYYREDVERLQILLERDLSNWTGGPAQLTARELAGQR